jgi:hypothetical protein
MKGKLLSFIFIIFYESSLFKDLQPKKIKKFSYPSTRVLGCGPNLSNSMKAFIPLPSFRRAFEGIQQPFVASISGFGKHALPLDMGADAANAGAIGDALEPSAVGQTNSPSVRLETAAGRLG